MMFMMEQIRTILPPLMALPGFLMKNEPKMTRIPRIKARIARAWPRGERRAEVIAISSCVIIPRV